MCIESNYRLRNIRLGIIAFLDFDHRLIFSKSPPFRKLDLSLSSINKDVEVCTEIKFDSVHSVAPVYLAGKTQRLHLVYCCVSGVP
jgi:hypothetical protein